MFIDKIKAKFKEKFPNVNLSQTRVVDLATKLNGHIKEDADIDTQLDLINTVTPFAEIARLDDVERNSKSSADVKAKAEADAKAKSDAEAAAKANDNKEIPSWAQELINDNKSLKERLEKTETQTVQEKRTASFKEKIKDLPQESQDRKLKAFSKMNFENDDDFNEHLTDTEAEASSYSQSVKDSSASGYKPQTAASSASTISKTEQEEINNAMNNANF